MALLISRGITPNGLNHFKDMIPHDFFKVLSLAQVFLATKHSILGLVKHCALHQHFPSQVGRLNCLNELNCMPLSTEVADSYQQAGTIMNHPIRRGKSRHHHNYAVVLGEKYEFRHSMISLASPLHMFSCSC